MSITVGLWSEAPRKRYNNMEQISEEKAQDVILNLRTYIKQYFEDNGLTYAVFGKSKGLDSSIIAGLLSDIPEIKPIGVILTCESEPEEEPIAREVLNTFQIPSMHVDLAEEFHTVMGQIYQQDSVHGQLAKALKWYDDDEQIQSMAEKKNLAAGNVKARLRMIYPYHIAQLCGGIVMSTDNLSEKYMGFWTLNGDVGDMAPIQNLFKGLEAYPVARALGVPAGSLNAEPTDGLDIIPGGTDKDQLGMDYEKLDPILSDLLAHNYGAEERKKDEGTSQLIAAQLDELPMNVRKVGDQMLNTEFKRNLPVTFSREELGLEKIPE